MFRYAKQVSIQNDGLPLARFIRLAFPLLPDFAVQKAFQNRDVKINGQRSKKTALVYEGNSIEIYTPSKQVQPGIVYQDHLVAIINKPSGISSDSENPDEYTVETWAHEYFDKPNQQPNICHRLDNQTTGLLLISLDNKAYEAILALFRERKIWKEYTSLVVGTPQPERAVCKAYLSKAPSEGRVKISLTPKKDTQAIVTEYYVIEPGDVARVKVILHTGRTHQIRAHMSFLGFPVLGDDVYGNRTANRIYKARKLHLCATALCIDGDATLGAINGKLFQIQPPF